MGSAQRVVVARAPRGAAIQHCLEYLGSSHLNFELEGSARSAVQFEGVLPEAAPMSCVCAGLSRRHGRVGIVVHVPPEVYKLVRLVVHLASTLNMAVDCRIPFVRKHMTLVLLASDTVRPNVAHMTTITPIIFLSCSRDCVMTPALSA